MSRIELAVDLCSGDGLFTAPLTMLARHVVAIDIDPRMLALAREHVTAVGDMGICEFIVGNADDIGRLATRPADLILLANTFGVPDKSRLARAVASVLKVGGRFIVLNWHKRSREETIVRGQPRGPRTEMRVAPHDVAAAVLPAGLIWVRTVELRPYHCGIIFEKPKR